MNDDRIKGTWETIVTVNGPAAPGVTNVAPEETRLATFASTPPAWPAVSRPSAAGYPQVTSISSVPSVDSSIGSAPGPMKTAAIQYGS
jgi:hypothetical protein